MSLKAKIEAVIYAAEDPVTLAQLVGLLGQEAQAELDHQDAAQQRLSLEAADPAFDSAAPDLLEQDLLNQEILSPEDDSSVESPHESPKISPADPVNPQPPSAHLSPATATAEPPTAPAPYEKALTRQARAREARLRDFFRDLVADLVRDFSTSDRGLEIREVAGGYRFATKPEYHDAVRGFVKSLKPPLKLSLQALETLAVVAYKQPVTAPEISEIRGVDSGGVLGSLLTRKLITTAGRKQVVGRPILYKTTKDFLLRFGLKDIAELPSIEEFERMAGDLAEPELLPEPTQSSQLSQEPPPMADPLHRQTSDGSPESITGANLEEERDATEPQADGDSEPLDNAAADDIAVDGRIVGLPPTQPHPIDSPAQDAEIQADAQKDAERSK